MHKESSYLLTHQDLGTVEHSCEICWSMHYEKKKKEIVFNGF